MPTRHEWKLKSKTIIFCNMGNSRRTRKSTIYAPITLFKLPVDSFLANQKNSQLSCRRNDEGRAVET